MPEMDRDTVARLARYVTGVASAEEAAEVERWIAAEPGRRDVVDQLLELWKLSAGRPDALRLEEFDLERARAEVKRQIQSGRSHPSPTFAVRAEPRWSWAWKAAAAVALVAGGGAAVRGLLRSGVSERVAAPAARVASTVRGQRASFQLPDGTRVMLGVASTLRYRMDAASGPREVALDGEAYFEVVHDERRPFIVRAGDVVAKDLGTEFVVRAYPEDAHARVVVRAGTVALGPARAAVSPAATVIKPGHLGRLAADGSPVIEPADTALYFAWTSGTLVFDGTPLREALPQLGRWFDLEFRLADSSLGDIRLAATLTNRPADDALSLLASALGLREVRHGRAVTFYRASPGR